MAAPLTVNGQRDHPNPMAGGILKREFHVVLAKMLKGSQAEVRAPGGENRITEARHRIVS